MSVLFRKTLLALAVLCACSCAKDKKAEQVSQLVIPADEATPDERQAVESTLFEIEKISRELGRPQSFRDIPVVVTSVNERDTQRHAACFSENGKGKFIQLGRKVLEREENFYKHLDETTLFPVLLHEIGHCYFGREHSEAQIDLHGHILKRKKAREGGNPVLAVISVPASVMGKEKLTMIRALKAYYVAEIVGLVPAPGEAALGAYSPFTVVEREPEPVLP